MYNYIPSEIDVEIAPDDLMGLESELVIDPDEIIALANSEELQGLEDIEYIRKLREILGRLRRPIAKAVIHRLPSTRVFRRLVEKTTHKAIQKVAPYIGRKGKGKVWYHRMDLVGSSIEFFSEKTNDTNIKKAGILADNDVVIKRISIWFSPYTLNATQFNDINEVLKGQFTLRVDNEVMLEVPVDLLADFNPTVDGSSSVVYILKNSKLDKGMLPLEEIHVPKGKTVEAEVTGFSVSSDNGVDITVGLVGIELI